MDDVIFGTGGDDTIDGGLGNDTIDGGDGDDSITGGACEMEWQAGGTTPSYLETDPAPNGTPTTTESFVNSDGDTVSITHSTTNGNIDESGLFGAVDDAHRLTTTGEVNTHEFGAPVSGAQLLFTASANGEKYSVTITLADDTVLTLSEAIAAGHLTVDTSASDETVVGDDIVGGGTAGNADSTFVTINSPIKSIDVTSTGINAGAMAYELYVDTNAPVQVEVPGTGDDSILGGAGNDTIDGECGDDTIDGGIGNDVIDGGTGDDILTGGAGDDTFIGLSGNDTITDFNTGNTGSITEGSGVATAQDNNDFVDLSGYYNATTLAAYNAANPSNTYDTPLEWMQADQADDGVLNDTIAGWDADNTLTIQSGGAATDAANLTYDNTNVVCFAGGTMIKTIAGEVAVEDLKAGDKVLTMDNGFQSLQWIGSRSLTAETLDENPNMKPIRIRAGALGNDLPEQDLYVSPQHRVLVKSNVAKNMFGDSEVLVAAKQLLAMDGIEVCEDTDGVDYYHFMFEGHEVVFSNGAPTESLYTGPQALKTLTPEAREEIFALFPELSEVNHMASSARQLIKGRPGRKMVERHIKNSRAIIAAVPKARSFALSA